MIEELSKWSALVCSPCLTAIHRVECLVEKQAHCPGGVYPWRTILVEGRIVPKQGYEVHNDEAEAGESDLEGNEQKSSRGSIGSTKFGLGGKSGQQRGCKSWEDCATHAIDIGKHLIATFV
jgi:hypothetical protein